MPKVTVVPADRLIIVDGEALHFDFPAPANLHALQWDDVTQTGHMEFVDDYNQRLATILYAEEVAPFVALWEAEKARLAAEAEAAEAARLAEYNSDPARYARLRAERDRRVAATDYLVMPDYPLGDDAKAAVSAYRQALRDLPQQEGAPWDGGGEETPWPVMPAPLAGKAVA